MVYSPRLNSPPAPFLFYPRTSFSFSGYKKTLFRVLFRKFPRININRAAAARRRMRDGRGRDSNARALNSPSFFPLRAAVKFGDTTSESRNKTTVNNRLLYGIFFGPLRMDDGFILASLYLFFFGVGLFKLWIFLFTYTLFSQKMYFQLKSGVAIVQIIFTEIMFLIN